MAGATLNTVYYDNDAVIQYLRALEDRVDNMAPVYRDIGEHMLKSTKKRFSDEEDPEGKPWEPLGSASRSIKPKNVDKILVLDGYMRDLLAYQVNSDSMQLGTNQVQGAMHQFGGVTSPKSMIPGKEVPARPFLGFSTDDSDEILHIVHQHLLRAI